jgi:hypothetical protein
MGCGTEMNVTFLWFDECAIYQQARQLLQEVMSERGVKGEVEEVNVTSDEVAEQYRFPGSPMIRIDGTDIEPGFEDAGDYAPRCCLYADSAPAATLRWASDRFRSQSSSSRSSLPETGRPTRLAA